MKAALLISGYLRTVKLNLFNIKKQIINNFESVDVYIHITKNENIDDKYFNPSDSYDTIKLIESELSPKAMLIESNIHFSDNQKENDLYNTWFKFYKLNVLKKEHEKIHSRYDIVIKIRPDVNLTKINFNKNLNNSIFLPENAVLDKSKLKNSSDKYVCDILSYGVSQQMDRYFDIYNDLKNLISKYGCVSETVLYHYLNNNNIKYIEDNIDYEVVLSMCNVFAICGDSGSGKSTMGNLLKNYFSNSFLLECDRYHKWERHDTNWKNYTHLNPEANFISKMEDDVFNLKIGNSIFQVDYDHNTGKFKDPEKINNADNIIVCGLHSLYNDNKYVYNISIYMDPDEKLKTKWKIDRDVKERGYAKEKVLNQINTRRNDYTKYILPQKESSDVIVNFYEDINDELKLNIYVSKKYTLEKIISMLTRYKIPYEFKSDLKFNVLTFNEYVYCELWNFGISDQPDLQYFNYIFYVILNLKTQN